MSEIMSKHLKREATIIKSPSKQKVNPNLRVVDNNPYRGVVLQGYRKMGHGKVFKVPVGYVEAFKPCLGDLATLSALRA